MRSSAQTSATQAAPLIALLFLLEVAFSPQSFAAAPEVDVKIVASRDEFLLGEPVLLRVTVSNTGMEPLLTPRLELRGQPEEEVKIFVSQDGRAFNGLNLGISGVTRYFASDESVELQPGKPWTFRLRLLYSADSPNRLAFSKIGRTFVKVEYPVHPASKRDWRNIPSNTAEVRIKKPTGPDAEVWEHIKAEKRLYFLQTGSLTFEDKKTHHEMLKFFKQFPDTPYKDALLYALRRYYRKEPSGPKSLGDSKEVRELLGLNRPLFVPYDPRLDISVVLDHPPSVSIGQMFESYSKQSGMPLSLPPFPRRCIENGARRTAVLREEMEAIGSMFDTTWIRRGNGYHLPAEESKNGFIPESEVQIKQGNN